MLPHIWSATFLYAYLWSPRFMYELRRPSHMTFYMVVVTPRSDRQRKFSGQIVEIECSLACTFVRLL
jgi:hypothetical protein